MVKMAFKPQTLDDVIKEVSVNRGKKRSMLGLKELQCLETVE